jgi:hypothetical protein
MRYAEAEDQLRVASDHIERESRDAALIRHAQLAREATQPPSLRRRAGEAVIAFGVRLAGDRPTARDAQKERRFVRAT